MPPYTRDRLKSGWLGNLPNLIILIALHENQIVGHAQIFKYPYPRGEDVGDLLIYLHQDFHNRGSGSAMLAGLIRLAKNESLHRIGLHVVAANKLAVRPCEKFDFKTEGTMKGSHFGEDGKYHDELAAGSMLASSTNPNGAP